MSAETEWEFYYATVFSKTEIHCSKFQTEIQQMFVNTFLSVEPLKINSNY